MQKGEGGLIMLHYMKINAEGDQPFTFNKHVMTRLDQWDQGADQVG
jgi:hypothetical protein